MDDPLTLRVSLLKIEDMKETSLMYGSFKKEASDIIAKGGSVVITSTDSMDDLSNLVCVCTTQQQLDKYLT